MKSKIDPVFHVLLTVAGFSVWVVLPAIIHLISHVVCVVGLFTIFGVCTVFSCAGLSIFTFGNVILNVNRIRIIMRIRSKIISALMATTCHPNIQSNNLIIGHEIYHPHSGYAVLLPSMIGKFKTDDTITSNANDWLISWFIKYHFAIIMIHTMIHSAKNIMSPISPNGIAAYLCNKSNIGDPFAKKNEKKYNTHSMTKVTHKVFLFNLIIFFLVLYLLLAKINH